MLRCLEKTGEQGDKDYSNLLEKLKQLQTSEAAAAEKSSVGEVWGLFEEVEPETAPAPPVVPAGRAPAMVMEKIATPTAETPASRPVSSISDTAIRVDVGQLDKLMNLVGELVLARNQIIQFTGKAKEPTLLNATQRLNLITTELQESVMKTRMQPIGNVWSKFPRIVRDVAHELGKRVKLVMEGQETELDRTIIEAIKDPLTHVIRNAIDHGIEPPAMRAAAGKPDEGMLILRAFHEGGQVNIEIMDDGQGINVARVKQKALEKSLLAPDQAAVISDRDVLNLVFLPGFSTAEKVTNVSGRRQFGEEKTRELLAWNNLPPKTYARVNALKLDDGTGVPTPAGRDAPQAPATAKMKEAGDLLTRWREENVEFELFERDWTGGNTVFELKTHPSLPRLGSFQDGWFYVQDPSTLLAPMLLDPQPGETILDLCAAPGGKTTLLAQRIHNQGRIVASDADLNRLKLVRDNCIRLGVTCVEFDNNLPSPDDGRKYERILVDAPCSNTGVMRRRVDLRWRIQPAELKRLSATQLELLHQAATRLAAGGVLVYSTCSLEAEENSERVRQFLEEQPGFRLETARQLLPFTDGVDGAYVARLKHVG